MSEQREPRTVWLFNSADFAGNPKWLFLYILNHRPDIEAVWMADNAHKGAIVDAMGLPCVVRGTREFRRTARRTRVWVVNQVKEKIPRPLQDAILLNLWHGVGNKSIERGMNAGYLYERIARKYITNNKYYHDNQLFLVTSEAMEEHFTKYIGLAERNKVRAGYPQNIVDPKSIPQLAKKADLRSRLGLDPQARVAVYTPTPRRDRSSNFLSKMLPDIESLVARLESTQTALILKMHPHMSNDAQFIELQERWSQHPLLKFWNNDDDFYEVMDQVNLAIVDYSSILYDFLAKGIAEVIRYIPDYDNGNNAVLQPGVDYLNLSCGAIANTFEDLLDLIDKPQPVSASTLQRLHDHFWSYTGPNNGAADMEKIIEAALSFEITDTPLPTLRSYDVFDTLIYRRGLIPTSVFTRVAEQAAESELDFPQYMLDNYVRIRRTAESSLRDFVKHEPGRGKEGRTEIRFDEIIQRIGAHFSLTEAQVRALKEWEIQEEVNAVFGNQELINEMLAYDEAGDKVILISDMYLPREVVTKLLASVDPRLARIPLYLSSDSGYRKATKQLFLEIYEDLNYDFASWIHTGDNRHSDVRMAKSLGIRAELVDAPKHDRITASFSQAIPTSDGDLVCGLLGRKRLLAEDRVDYFTYAYISPALVAYIDWVIDDAINRGYRHLVFMTRDGDLLKHAADAIIEARELPVTTQLIYGSRRAWRLAAQADGLHPDTFEAWGLFGAPTPKELLSALDLSSSQLTEMVPELSKILEQEFFSSTDLVRIRDIAKDSKALHHYLLNRAKSDENLAVRYLRQELDPATPTCFVEFWGRGYTQDCLAHLLSKAFGDGLITPMYYARSIYPSQPPSIRYNITMANHNMLAIESVLSNLPYGTTLGYELNSETGLVDPVYETQEPAWDLYQSLLRQIPQFAHDFSTITFRDIDATRRAVFHATMDHIRKHPTDPYYIDFLADLPYSVAIGARQSEFAPPLTLEDLIEIFLGAPRGRYTRSFHMSLKRSNRRVRRIWRELNASLEEGLSRKASLDRVLKASEKARSDDPRIDGSYSQTGASGNTWRRITFQVHRIASRIKSRTK